MCKYICSWCPFADECANYNAPDEAEKAEYEADFYEDERES
jgi:hypothetical protein